MTFEILFTIGNILFLCASYPMIKSAYADRNALKGYSKIGSSFTFFGMLCMILGFLFMGSYITAIIAIPTMIYWGIVSWCCAADRVLVGCE